MKKEFIHTVKLPLLFVIVITSIHLYSSLNHIKLITEIEKVTKKKMNISQVIQLTSVRKIDELITINEKKAK